MLGPRGNDVMPPLPPPAHPPSSRFSWVTLMEMEAMRWEILLSLALAGSPAASLLPGTQHVLGKGMSHLLSREQRASEWQG